MQGLSVKQLWDRAAEGSSETLISLVSTLLFGWTWKFFLVLFSNVFLERDGEEQYRGSKLPDLSGKICLCPLFFF